MKQKIKVGVVCIARKTFDFEAAVIGADIVTAGFDVYKSSFEHPFTDKGLKIFQDAWDETELGSL